MSNSFLDAVHREQAAEGEPGEPELTPVEKIQAGLKQNEDDAIEALGAEVDGLSEIAKKAQLYKGGNNAATRFEFSRAEKNRKVILGLKAKYQPVREALGPKYQPHLQSHEARLYWERVQGYLRTLDDIFNV
jgi:hypothetical protein